MGNTEMEARAYNAQEKTEFVTAKSKIVRTITFYCIIPDTIHIAVVNSVFFLNRYFNFR